MGLKKLSAEQWEIELRLCCANFMWFATAVGVEVFT
jgi:hypothetical protein